MIYLLMPDINVGSTKSVPKSVQVSGILLKIEVQAQSVNMLVHSIIFSVKHLPPSQIRWTQCED